ncbi:MAG: PstS family phosphate ABC transporter substrate-binding protein [Cyanobacteria bacterium CRU_2_1]|nr:PstS family phosphate ABC transporter substrate-binding protein [Cyanobacteria bacterium RU_5_0]NJR61481.1 PstS family phosphate ABC transporter substrate-binding protein [Cyanobacteria bacterium CRU_2_1]
MVANGVKVKLNRLTVMGAIAAVATAVSATAVLSQGNSEIAIDGSSTVFPITEAVAEDFQIENAGINVTVGVSGTGGGFTRFCAGETDISNASRPIKTEEIEACQAAGIEYIELPIAYDALTVVVNSENTLLDSITVEELKTLWAPEAQGTITLWSQIRDGFPDETINLYGPGTDSGTFDYFTEAIVGDSGASRADYTASEDDNVLVQGVASDPFALGYFGFAYYEANSSRLKALAIDNGDGPVAPTRENVENGTYQPLSRPLFIYVNAEAAQRPEIQAFVEYYLTNTDLVTEVGYVPLPARAYELSQQHFSEGATGTRFANRDIVGIDIEELLQLEAE